MPGRSKHGFVDVDAVLRRWLLTVKEYGIHLVQSSAERWIPRHTGGGSVTDNEITRARAPARTKYTFQAVNHSDTDVSCSGRFETNAFYRRWYTCSFPVFKGLLLIPFVSLLCCMLAVFIIVAKKQAFRRFIALSLTFRHHASYI